MKNRLRKESVGYKKERLTALYLLQSGLARHRKQVATLIGVSRETVHVQLAELIIPKEISRLRAELTIRFSSYVKSSNLSPTINSPIKLTKSSERLIPTFQTQVETVISEKQSRSVRLFCQDESRLGILPVAQRRINFGRQSNGNGAVPYREPLSINQQRFTLNLMVLDNGRHPS